MFLLGPPSNSFYVCAKGGDNVRFAITFQPPVEAANAFEKDPKAAETLFGILQQAKPEAIYASSSTRFMIIIMNADSHEDLLRLLAPIWHTMKVYPKVDTVLNMEEFKAVFQKIGEVVKDL